MERIFRTLYRSHLDAKAPTGIPVGVFSCLEQFILYWNVFEDFKALLQNKSTNYIDNYRITYGFYSNGNNVCNRNELGRLLIYQHDAL